MPAISKIAGCAGPPPLVLLLVQVLANETPYKVLLALDALQALETVKTQTPCLLILDYFLPGMKGFPF